MGERKKDFCLCSFSCTDSRENQEESEENSQDTRLIRAFTIFVAVCLFRATPMAHGGSQARGQIRAVAASLHHWVQALSVTYITAHSNSGSLTHCARPGIKPVSSWILVRFLSTEP